MPGDPTESGFALLDLWPKLPKPRMPRQLPEQVQRAYLQAETNFAQEKAVPPAGAS